MRYLSRKERLLCSSTPVRAAGEEELLAVYLRDIDDKGEHCFNLPHSAGIVYTEGFWENFKRHPQRLAQIAANEISYSWDRLIEIFAFHIRNNSQYYATDAGPGRVSTGESILRFLAAEPRTHRRLLAERLNDLVRRTPATGVRGTRVVLPSNPGSAFYYVFLVLPWDYGTQEGTGTYGEASLSVAAES